MSFSDFMKEAAFHMMGMDPGQAPSQEEEERRERIFIMKYKKKHKRLPRTQEEIEKFEYELAQARMGVTEGDEAFMPFERYQLLSECLVDGVQLDPEDRCIRRCNKCDKSEYKSGFGLKDGVGGADKYKLCGRCKQVYYCSVECQKADWKEHKVGCKAPQN
uniref:MYND-type domain-containing protein n=1 Tax=Paramoeba aestuarina TaxID=180227 RepID=A0A7S4JL00_9EUKA|mmetsp:Transcript_11407/g.17259  ORF Transcript_11407/g.17259 Transcript_11407/m.17259 type:complete len:161 (+) Transcript_11407:102-584(+)